MEVLGLIKHGNDNGQLRTVAAQVRIHGFILGLRFATLTVAQTDFRPRTRAKPRLRVRPMKN